MKRNEIYLINLEPSFGSEQGRIRPCLIVQNNIGNIYSNTTIIVPLTTKLSKNRFPVHIDIEKKYSGLSKDSCALTNQIKVIDKSRIIKRIGEIKNQKIIIEIDRAIKASLALD